MTSLTSFTAYIITKYWKNFERKYNNNSIWIIDSGVSDHMTSNKSYLSSYKWFDCLHKVILGDNSEMYAKGKGKLYCYFGLGDDNYRVSNYAVTLQNILFVPKFDQSLLSVRKADEHRGHVVLFGLVLWRANHCWLCQFLFLHIHIEYIICKHTLLIHS